MHLDRDACQNLERSLRLEWLEPNGRGGFASGTVAGANTRRYHALLLVARRPPVDRCVLVNHLEEWVENGADTFPLSTNVYGDVVHPDAYRRCEGFTTDPWPTWTYRDGTICIQREIFCPWGRDLVVVKWRLMGGPSKGVRLKIKPMLTGRDYHATHHENGSVLVQAWIADRQVTWQTYGGLPQVHARHNGDYRHAPDWYRRVQFSAERERGLDDQEDWWSPGEIGFALVEGSTADLVLTTESGEPGRVAELEETERSRRKQLVESAPSRDPLAKALWCAAPAYLSSRGKGHTVIAGYPWFTDWGRDTFISLPGLFLVTGRFELAWHIIEAFSAHVSAGMVPNRFPDVGEQPEYNTIDASLWFIHAVDRYLSYSGDDVRVRQTAWPTIKQILDGYRAGTRFGIRMDHDGLIIGGEPGAQLTWMDVKVGEWVVTPRHGKPVEIQALWVRTLAAGETLATRYGEQEYAARCREDRERAIRSFRERFWCATDGYLYDVIDGPEGDDRSLRPNQLYAVAFGDGLVTKEQAGKILDIVRSRLLTPVGVRTLSADDPRYRPRYDGDVASRDGAYHQGTVWPFLLGPLITAWIKTKGKTPTVKKAARQFLSGLESHLGEACLGQVSEIFDAEPPHLPRGCTAQAWSVAEPLRVLMEDLGVKPATVRATANKPTGVSRARTSKRTSRTQPRDSM